MDPFTLDCSALPDRPRVLAFRGEEELGRCFEYDVLFTLDDDAALGLDAAGVLGAAARLVLGDGVVEIAGHVAELELLEDVPFAVLRMRIVPALWFLGRSAHNRVFVDESIPDIYGKVLAGAGIAKDGYELRLKRDYTPREHVCQYQESDLDFLQRWMEREGQYFFFDHGAGSKLVICDDKAAHEALRDRPVTYHPITSTDESSKDHFHVIRASLSALAKEVAEADYNYLTPDTVITATASVSPELTAQARRWAVNEPDVAGARRVADLRAERELCGRSRLLAKGAALGVHAGFTFAVERHPMADLDRDYLAVRTVLRGQLFDQRERFVPLFDEEEIAALGRDTFSVEVEAIASDVAFRPPARTPWPHATGLELGIVDGPADSDYAQLDEHGRYNVKLMMDENPSPAGKASARVRMIQPHGGEPEGWHLPLRKGTEVLVAFTAGDPDRPVIAAAVPNAHTPSPVTRANNTQNVGQTGGLSRLEIEDEDGKQYVDVSTPPEHTYMHLGVHAGLGDHNLVLSTSGDGLLHTGGNRDITVGGVQTEDVKGSLTEAYHGTQSTHVSAAFTETVDASATQTIHAGRTQTTSGGLTETISGGEKRDVSGGVTETITGARTQTISGGSTESVTGSQTQTILGGSTITSGAKYTVKADGGIKLTSAGPINMMANSWLMNAAGGQVNVDDYFLRIASKDCKFYATQCQPNVININVAAMNAGAIGERYDVVTRKYELAVAVAANAGTRMNIGAAKVNSFGATLALGFLMFI